MSDKMEDALRNARLVDTHYHIGPEFLDRRYDVLTLAEAARASHTSVVLKNHTYPTTPLAALARAHLGVEFLGSVVLNRFVGGLNADAVYGAASGNRARICGKSSHEPTFIVYMPTIHAASHLRTLGHSFDPRWSCGADPVPRHAGDAGTPVQVFDEDLMPAGQLSQVLSAIVDTDATLATGHLSAAEIMRLVPMAIEAGVQRILITHPHYPSVDLDDNQLAVLVASPRVFIEHCFAIHTIEEVPLERFAASIRATGPSQVVLSTDFGQVRSDAFPDGLVNYANKLYELLGEEMTDEEFIAMFSDNGRRALRLSESSNPLGPTAWTSSG